MNKLSTAQRARILSLLVEGMSMRSVSRLEGVSINTVSKLLVDAGRACAQHHDETMRNVEARHIQCDEIWSFVYAKEKTVPRAKAAPPGAGDVWTWTAIEADSKLILSYEVGDRSAGTAFEFMLDLRDRLASPHVQLTTDGHKAYLQAVDGVFGADIDYAMLVKLYGTSDNARHAAARYSPAKCTGIRKRRVSGMPDKGAVSTSYVERQNLTMRMGMRRFTRLTNAFSKKLENHLHMLAIYFTHYNFVRPHKSLEGDSPAVWAGLAHERHSMEWMVEMIDARTPPPQKPGPKRGSTYKPRHTKSK